MGVAEILRLDTAYIPLLVTDILPGIQDDALNENRGVEGMSQLPFRRRDILKTTEFWSVIE